MITVWVPGCPKTKGSMEVQHARGGRGRAPRLVQSVDGSERWAALVAESVKNAMLEPMSGPVAVRMVFWLPVADVAVGRPGDIDKLARNVLDALTKAGVYEDDAQVVEMPTYKYPARSEIGPGVLIQAWRPTYYRDDWIFTDLQARRRDMGLTS